MFVFTSLFELWLWGFEKSRYFFPILFMPLSIKFFRISLYNLTMKPWYQCLLLYYLKWEIQLLNIHVSPYLPKNTPNREIVKLEIKFWVFSTLKRFYCIVKSSTKFLADNDKLYRWNCLRKHPLSSQNVLNLYVTSSSKQNSSEL